MVSLPIIPRYKVLMQYDIRADYYETYYRYVLGEFIPALQNMGLYSFMVWHIAYGDYPMRQVEFVADSWQTLQKAFQSENWVVLENRLKTYTLNYHRKVVHFQDRFQF